MKATVKAVLSPDIPDLAQYSPTEQDNFGFLLQLLIGPENGDGMESLEVTVCTPKWLATLHDSSEIIVGQHHLIVFEYDYDLLMRRVNSLVAQCDGDTWNEVALKLTRIAKWEFEDHASG
ncbi:MAG: immunity 8 family protein [Anaerolineae bacterium]|nr:immunity 8 family protein [Anaerolineae bacterium]